MSSEQTNFRPRENEKRKFFELADTLTSSTDAAEHMHLKRELARMTFGDKSQIAEGRALCREGDRP